MKTSSFIIVISLLVSSMLNVCAAENNRSWETLPDNMQSLLGDYRQDWDKLPAAQRNQLVTLGERWVALPESQQMALWVRFQRWQNMSPQNRQDMQQAYQHFKALPASERQRLMRSHESYEHMNPSKQQEMMQRFQEFQQRSGNRRGSSGSMMTPSSEGSGGSMDMGPGMMNR